MVLGNKLLYRIDIYDIKSGKCWILFFKKLLVIGGWCFELLKMKNDICGLG